MRYIAIAIVAILVIIALAPVVSAWGQKAGKRMKRDYEQLTAEEQEQPQEEEEQQ